MFKWGRVVRNLNVTLLVEVDVMTTFSNDTLKVNSNEHQDISICRKRDCLLKGLYRLTTKVSSKTKLVTGGFPSQRGSNVESVSMSLRHHGPADNTQTWMDSKDHFGYGISQWEMTLQHNITSHWLSPCPEWSPGSVQSSRHLRLKQYWKQLIYNLFDYEDKRQ